MTTRIRKAWFVKARDYDDGDTVFAPSGGKARYQLLLRLRDIDAEATFADIVAQRARWADVHLPAPAPIVSELTDQERRALLHSFGFNSHHPEKAGYRNHYCTTPDDPVLVSLSKRGLMKPMGQGTAGRGLVYFLLTDVGRDVALSMVPEYAP
jgi:hypothetical protein